MEPPEKQPDAPRPVSEELRHVSVKSIRSRFDSQHLSTRPTEPRPKPEQARPVSPVPSCVSMKSERSMGEPLKFSSGPPQFDSRPAMPRPVSPVPSCVSMKSDRSMGEPPKFSSGPPQSDSRPEQARQVSPVPSCVSMKSDRSMGEPLKFSSGPPQSDSRNPDQPICGVCEQLLISPVITTCGHSFCRQCINSYCSQSGPSGDYSCPQCRQRCRTQPVINPDTTMIQLPSHNSSTKQTGDNALRAVLMSHKANMKRRFEKISEGIMRPGAQTLLNKIYTELFITEGESEGINQEHEVWQVESASRPVTTEDTAINCNDIFRPLPGQDERIRTVMTKGIAGIGKTISVQKFILDWAEDNANQDVDFMFVLPFRELNLVKDGQYSLHRLLLDFHTELKDLQDDEYKDCHIVFLFDGLDESRLPLNFQENQKVSDVKQTTSVDVLMTSLIQGSLLQSALIWITSRPAAASQIPSQCVNLVTEVRGFNDPQKEEYFRKRVSDQSLADRLITHIKETRSLYIMCHMPVFCWIAATVLQQMLEQNAWKDVPKTLTEMFIHFLLIQTTRKSQKYEERSDEDRQRLLGSHKEVIFKLAELAFKHLENGNLMFYEEDLRECGIDVSEASVYSGMCTEIFREECVFDHKKVYCFVHLSIQEFLAAIFIFHSYMSGSKWKLVSFLKMEYGEPLSLHILLKKAMHKALESRNGHLDLFLRFLVGISVMRNQKLLQGLLSKTYSSSEDIKKTCQYIRGLWGVDLSPERGMNLLHCLLEMKDETLHKEIQNYLRNGDSLGEQGELSPVHCSGLAHMLLMSDEVLDELDLRKYQTSEEGRRRLVPAVRCCRKAVLAGCKLTEKSYEIVMSALQSANSSLRELDLGHNDLHMSGEKLLSALLSPNCKLETLRLNQCDLSKASYGMMALVLQDASSTLKELDMSGNDLQDEGVELLCLGLRHPLCKLETLRLFGCQISHKGCSSLASALKSNPSHLKEIDLCYNHPGDSGVRELTDSLNDSSCKLQTLRCDHGGECRMKPGLRKYACELTLDPNTAATWLSLSEGNRKVTRGEQQPYPDHPDRFDTWPPQVLCREGLTGRCYWEAEWSGNQSHIAVAYKSIRRKGGGCESSFGRNDKSWSLECSSEHYTALHNNKSTKIPAPSPHSSRVGVYLDWPAGTLSFYSVSSDTFTHLHTFHSTFTEPLYPGVLLYYSNSPVFLCQIT